MVHAAIAEARARRGARADDARAERRSRSSASCSRRRRRCAASPRCSSTPPCATSRSCASSGCRSGRATCASAGRRRRVPGAIGEPVEVGGAHDPPGRRRRARRRRRGGRRAGARRRGAASGARARGARAREAREARGRRALLRPRRPAGARGASDASRSTTSRGSAHAELLTPKPDESLRFFVDVLGMEEEARDGQSVYLRGWGDYLRYSLKLTESPQRGARPHGAARLEPRGARAARGGDRGDRARARAGSTATSATAPRTASRIPTGTSSSSTTRPSATSRPSTCGRRGGTSRSATSAAAPRSSASTTSTCWRPTCARAATFAQDVLGYRLYERIELDDGTETGAWLSLSIAAHELIYVADAYGATRPAAPPRVLGRHARGVPARGRPLRRRGRPDRGGAVEARGRTGLLPVRVRAGRQPDRGHDRRLLRLRPGLRADRVDGGRSARAASTGA